MKSLFTTFLVALFVANFNFAYCNDLKFQIMPTKVEANAISISVASNKAEQIDYKSHILIIRPSDASPIAPKDSIKYTPNNSFINTNDNANFDSLTFSGEKNQIIAFNSEYSTFTINNLTPETYYVIDLYTKIKKGYEYLDSLKFTTLAPLPEGQVKQIQVSNITHNSLRIFPYGAIAQHTLVTLSSDEYGDPRDNPINAVSYKSNSDYENCDYIEASGANVVMSANDTTNAVTVTGLRPGTKYYIKAFAFNGTDLTCNYLTSKIENANSRYVVTNLETPTLIKFSSSSKNANSIAQWTKIEGATKYFIEVALDENFQELDDTYGRMQVGDVDSYEFDELKKKTKYFIRVQAANSIATSIFSNVKNIKN